MEQLPLSYKGYIFNFYVLNGSTYLIKAKNVHKNIEYEGKGLTEDIDQYSEEQIYNAYFRLMSNDILEINDNDKNANIIKLSFKGNNNINIQLESKLDFSLNKKKQKIKVIDTKVKIESPITISSLLLFPEDYIICGCIDGNIKIYSSSFDPKCENENAHDKSIHYLEIKNKNENSFFSCSQDLTIKLWNIINELNNYRIEHLLTLNGQHNDNINKLIYCENFLYSCSSDKSIIIFEEKNNKLYTVTNKIKDKCEIISFLVIKELNNTIISSGANETRIWKLDNNKYVECKTFYDLSCYGKNSLARINKEIIAIGGKDVSLLSLKNFNLIKKININFACWTILHIDYNILIGGCNNYIKIYDDKNYINYENIQAEPKIIDITIFSEKKLLFYSTDKIIEVTYEYT